MKTIFQKLSIYLAVVALFIVENGSAQPGCTDPQANNFDPMATVNDGSCIYPTTNYAPDQIAVLPSNLTECSGLAFFDDHLWTHLDGGNTDQLYEIDTLTGALKKTVTIPNSDNIDWEDLAEDDEHIYIGNFGNNYGNRTNLGIYKIKKAALVGGTPSPELIKFSFSDQTDFTAAQNANNYDCEAFFYWQDSLHLFSKNWLDFKTRHYVMPASPGTHIAELRDSLNVNGQVTAADISEEGVVLLLGYNKSTAEPFMWLLFDFIGSNIFSGNKRRISLVNPSLTGQVEGIVFQNATRGYICSEEFIPVLSPARLLSFDIAEWLQGPVAIVENNHEINFSIFPNPANEFISINFNDKKIPPPLVNLIIVDLSGKKIMERFFKSPFPQNTIKMDVSDLPPGAYLINLDFENKITAHLFYKE